MKEITIPAEKQNLYTATDFVTAHLEEVGCPPSFVLQIEVAVDELFTNIASYAYEPGEGDATIRIREGETNAVTITFIDEGKPFDPLKSTEPDTTLPADDRPIGGLGILIVKKTMSEVFYERKDGKNVLTIRKVW